MFLRRTPVKHLLRDGFTKACHFETELLLCVYWMTWITVRFFRREGRKKKITFLVTKEYIQPGKQYNNSTGHLLKTLLHFCNECCHSYAKSQSLSLIQTEPFFQKAKQSHNTNSEFWRALQRVRCRDDQQPLKGSHTKDGRQNGK